MESFTLNILRGAKAKLGLVLAGALFTFASQATPLLEVNSTGLTAGDSTQLGRISRNGVPSDWSAPKLFPGVINATTAYQFETFSVNVGQGVFLQILIDSLSANTFVSAYLGSYNPTNLALNYLGDAGASGNGFGGVDPLFFQVQVPAYSTLVLVVNETTGAGLGLLQPFKILVEGFVDTEFTDVPEPGTLGLAAFALFAFFMVRRRTARNAA